MLVKSKQMSLSKLIYVFLLCATLSACASEDAIISSDEGLVSPTDISIDIIKFSLEQQEKLKEDEGIYILGGMLDNAKTKLPCRWSDDPDGSIYGVVDCKGGTCGAGSITNANAGTQQIVISCTDSAGGISVGASRGTISWP
jgi:hypothetical protein